MESFQCWDCSIPTLQVWSNSSFSMEICWFLLFHSIWTLSNLSNIPILLEYYWENHTNTNWECVIEWVIQFVLEVMWFYFVQVRDVEVMWVERFVMELFQVVLFYTIPTLEVKEVYKQLRSECHFVSLYFWVRDDEEMLTLSLRMEVDSVQNSNLTKVFEVMPSWRLLHSIQWFHIQSIQDVEVLSMCRLDSICYSNLVLIAHTEWYMFEFDCVMLWLHSNPQSFLVHIHIQVWKYGDVWVSRLSLEFFFSSTSLSKWLIVLNTYCVYIFGPISQKFSTTMNINPKWNYQFSNQNDDKTTNKCEKIKYTILLFVQLCIFWFHFRKFIVKNFFVIIIVCFKFRKRQWIVLTYL
jgi:hypothetical protein